MEMTSAPTKFIIYARKSEESEDRQVQSIDDQLSRLREIARQRQLTVVDTLTEARSAKTPETRPVFTALLSRIEAGEAEGVLCWQINRLSRNPIDSGRIAWLLQRGVVRSILTPEREYRPEDNVLLLSVETGMANQYILDLSRNVKRGMRGKVERGELPGLAPAGYLNDRLAKTIVRDPERFPLIERAWRLLLTGNYSAVTIVRRLNDDWGFRTPQRTHSGGKPLSISAMYSIFANPFYAGLLRSHGQLFPGNHVPMITLDEFDRGQRFIHQSGRAQPSKRDFAFSRLFRCGRCGCAVTAEEHTKFIKSQGRVRHYTYYHCTRKKRGADCREVSIRAELLATAVTNRISELSITKSFRDAAVRLLNEDTTRATDAELARREGEAKVGAIRRQLAQLLDLCVRDVITEREMIERRNALTGELAHLEVRATQFGIAEERKRGQLIEALSRLEAVDVRFVESTVAEQRDLLTLVSSNRTIQRKKAQIPLKECWELIAKEYPGIAGSQRRLEPTNRPMLAGQIRSLERVNSKWRSLLERVLEKWDPDEYDREQLELQQWRDRHKRPPSRRWRLSTVVPLSVHPVSGHRAIRRPTPRRRRSDARRRRNARASKPP